jgi:hypothetical protein
VAVRQPGDDDRPTVDLGPRPDFEAEGGATVGEDPGDLGPDDATRAEGTQATPTPDPVHGLPTQQLASSRKAGESHATRYSTATSPVEAMRLEEIARTQVFLKVAILTSLSGGLLALLTKGNLVGFYAVMAGCVLTIAGAVWMFTIVRDPAKFSHRRIIVPALIIGVGSFGGVYYWGVASPVAAMITYGIYFFSLGANARITTALYIVVSVLHAALMLLIIGDVIDDRGIINIEHVRTCSMLMMPRSSMTSPMMRSISAAWRTETTM